MSQEQTTADTQAIVSSEIAVASAEVSQAQSFADIPGTNGTTALMSVGGTYNNVFEVAGDVDWIGINLVAGTRYTINLSGYGANPSPDTALYIWLPGSTATANTGYFTSNDDISSTNYNSSVTFMATVTGTFYIEAYDQYGYGGNTGYQISVVGNGALSNYTTAQIANQLVNGYWNFNGEVWRKFNVGGDNALTVNLTGLDATFKDIALKALQTWTDITGIQFTQVTTGGEITFSEPASGISAFSTSNTSGNTILSSTVSITADWLTSQGANYTLQTFIHEIGHAIGLGHGGNYNGSATYGVDNQYLNDSWAASIMSYFDQMDNTFVDASFAYLLTPMLADIAAIQQLYGNPNTTRTGNSTYGYSSNTGDLFDFDTMAANGGNFAFTIIDDGGTDFIDLANSTHNNRVDLTAGTASDILGLVGNMFIDSNTTIENVTTGSGTDNIKGNGAANVLNGGSGNDKIDGGLGNDRIYYDAADSVAFVTGGGGTDTLVIVGNTAPTSYNLAAGSFELAEQQMSDASGQWWSTQVISYNSSWARLTVDGAADDGRTWHTDYDLGSLWYSSVENWKNTSNQLIYTNYTTDGGLLVNQAWDYDSSQWWVYFTNYYNASNQIANTDGVANDNRYWSTSNDLSGGQWWTTYTVWYDKQDAATRHVINEEGVADDGRHWTTTYDVNNQYSWNTETNWFDSGNHLLYTTHT